MKKLALLALTLPVLGLTFMACTDAGDPYVPNRPTAGSVTIMINDLVGDWDADGLYLRGALTGDQNVNLTQSGIMWMATVNNVSPGTHGYAIYSDDGAKAEVVVRDGLEILVNDNLQVSGDTDVELMPGAGTGFRLVVTNNNQDNYDNIKMKGSYDGWATTERDGQSEDGVTVYRNIAAGLAEGTYEWGVVHDDGSEFGVWLLPPGPNLMFDIAADGSVSGETTFEIAAPQPMVMLTFNCDMNDFLGGYEVVQVRGTFNGWNDTPTAMTDEDQDGIFSVTVEVEENSEQIFKFITDGANYESVPSECGVDDGFGGYNRTFQMGTEDASYTAPFGGCPATF
jgi:hypothetical protein